MKCDACGMKLRANDDECPRCGGAGPMSPAERRRAEFESLPPCYACAGTGITARPKEYVEQSEHFKRAGREQISTHESRGIAPCSCPRGKWMAEHGKVFQPVRSMPVRQTKVIA